jgi:acyl-CoA thioester hydrolase
VIVKQGLAGSLAAATVRLDRQGIDAAGFPVRAELRVRFDDLDLQGHVNNAAASVMLQEGRVEFNRLAGVPQLGPGLYPVVAATVIEYARELTWPGAIEIRTGVVSIGRTSFTLLQLGRQNGASALYAQTTVVVSGPAGPAPIPEAVRESLVKLWVVAR